MEKQGQNFRVFIGSAVIVMVAYLASVYLKPQGNTQPQAVSIIPLTPTPSPVASVPPAGSSSSAPPAEIIKKGQSGTYTQAVGYQVHSNNEQISVTLTLDNSVITNVSTVDSKTNPMSTFMQESFENSIHDLVVGKNINDVNLASVGGASFTTAAFMEAVARIKNNI